MSQKTLQFSAEGGWNNGKERRWVLTATTEEGAKLLSVLKRALIFTSRTALDGVGDIHLNKLEGEYALTFMQFMKDSPLDILVD